MVMPLASNENYAGSIPVRCTNLFCSVSEMDITIDYESIIEGSTPSQSAILVLKGEKDYV